MDFGIFLIKMISLRDWLVVLIGLMFNLIIVAIFIRHTKKVQKKHEEIRKKFTAYLADLDKKNERLYRQNQKLKSKSKSGDVPPKI